MQILHDLRCLHGISNVFGNRSQHTQQTLLWLESVFAIGAIFSASVVVSSNDDSAESGECAMGKFAIAQTMSLLLYVMFRMNSYGVMIPSARSFEQLLIKSSRGFGLCFSTFPAATKFASCTTTHSSSARQLMKLKKFPFFGNFRFNRPL